MRAQAGAEACLDEAERLAILNGVKGGDMSVNEAVLLVVEHKKRQNCVIC